MSVESFLDTNVLVYAATGRDARESKRKRALELIEGENFGLSAQVLQEFYVTVVHKAAITLTPAQALEWIEQLEAFPCLPVDAALVKIAAESSERHRLAYWDAAILAAAEILGARTVYSEDLNHGQLYGAVRVCNPFRPG
ncbi:MAG: PIN domain-containing protein [Acidobacteria bacterium]|nr:PIN domain-containing protein [Acidobacteriota bacterium]